MHTESCDKVIVSTYLYPARAAVHLEHSLYHLFLHKNSLLSNFPILLMQCVYSIKTLSSTLASSLHTSSLLAAQTLGVVGSLIGGVVGTFTATTLLYIVVLLTVICYSRCFDSKFLLLLYSFYCNSIRIKSLIAVVKLIN